MGIFRTPLRWACVAVLLAAAVVAPVLGPPQPSQAVVGTNDYPYKTASWQRLDPWGFYYRECVSFVAWRMNNDNRVAFTNFMKGPNGRTGHWGNAYQWQANALNIGFPYNQTAARGAVAWWKATAQSTKGHVAYVAQKNADGSILVEEYNAAGDHNYRTRTIRSGTSTWPTGFIHIKDLGPGSQLPASDHQLVGDVNGDGRADAVVFYPAGTGLAGNWYVATSTGSAFAPASAWAGGMGPDSSKQALADVNGDGKADAVMYWSASGTYYVALSTGTSFRAPTQWSTQQIAGSNNQMMGDVNGDGKADAVVYSAGNGTWYASLSNGSSFTGFGQWTTGHGAGSASQLLADVTGDGRADAVAYFGAPNGWWYVAPSTGSAFRGTGPSWINGYGSGSTRQLLGDVNGDRRADAVPYFGGTNGWWYVALSNGATAFTSAARYANGFGVNSSNQLIGDVNGDGKADAIVYEGGNLGNWWIALSTGGNSPFSTARQWRSNYGIGS